MLRMGRTVGWTDNVKTVYPPYNFVIAGGIISFHWRLKLAVVCLQPEKTWVNWSLDKLTGLHT